MISVEAVTSVWFFQLLRKLKESTHSIPNLIYANNRNLLFFLWPVKHHEFCFVSIEGMPSYVCLINIVILYIPSVCQKDEFKCNNSLCVPMMKICDGENDCSDGSDEHSCNGKFGWLVGWLCLTSHRQRGHLETAPPFTVPWEGREAR